MKFFKVIYNLAILAIFILGIIYLLKKEYYLAFIWIVLTPVLMLLPRNLYKISWISQKYNKNLLNVLEIFVLIFLISGAGLPLGLKYLPIDIDSYLHFSNAIFYTILWGILYYVIKNKIAKKEIRKNEVILFAFIFNIIFGVVLWERFQLLNDQLFGTKMYFDYFQNADFDSMLDQIFGTLGTVFAGILMYFKLDDWINKWRR
ncbi:MAG: hypothetical protein QT11_C0001G0109 [archaeon GW2011_AR20]|nr:MAG: hypothetical protein QT11_C0001G0109 [archaeon GW2011_AR20]MBS3160713.1 hypothetical protein [Candidatus Woesearchaeota archaeon]